MEHVLTHTYTDCCQTYKVQVTYTVTPGRRNVYERPGYPPEVKVISAYVLAVQTEINGVLYDVQPHEQFAWSLIEKRLRLGLEDCEKFCELAVQNARQAGALVMVG